MPEVSTLQKAVQGNLIELLGLSSLPAEEQAKIISNLANLAGVKAMKRIFDKLLPSEQSKFEGMLEESQEVAAKWLHEKGILFEEILMEEVAKIKEDLLKRTGSIE